MTNSNRRAPDRPTMLNPAQIEKILEREREAATEGVLLGLCLAALSGAIMMAFLIWVFSNVVA